MLEDIHAGGLAPVDKGLDLADGERDGLGEEGGDRPVARVAVPGDGDEVEDGFGDEADSVVELRERRATSKARREGVERSEHPREAGTASSEARIEDSRVRRERVE